ncbi:hypothetical protein WAZ07_08915 [Bacillus sp. FJAT-51639]|uniref:Glycosyl transferase n=1 Tax=Bacillus bruguierae TaxID=3127667 RepID=A0ABU8FFH5_9BACI
MHSFCTLFNSNYLTRGLTMYDSLCRTEECFTLFIFCFDDLAYEMLRSLNLKNAVLITLNEFETDELKEVKKLRSEAEYCWTCTPHVIRHVLDNYDVKEVTYLDADLYFFNKPSILLDEFHQSNCSVMITEHRYSPEYDQSDTFGIYCVQFITFKADNHGLKVLQWWEDRCLEWCYNRVEDGKFGDQKYLDRWPDLFVGVHVLQHLGGGVACWNIQQYEVTDGPQVCGVPIVFYHFHQLRWDTAYQFDYGVYELSQEAISLIYGPYIQALREQIDMIVQLYDQFKDNYTKDNSEYDITGALK